MRTTGHPNLHIMSLNRTEGNGTTFIDIQIMGHALGNQFVCFASTFFILIIITALVCNTILLSIIVSVRKLHTAVNIFIVNLAVGDIITAIGALPFDVEFFLRGYFSRGIIACGVMQTTFLISLPSSVLCLALITAERFITIVFSLREVITKRRVLISIMIMWVYSLITATFPLMYDGNSVEIKKGICYLKFPLGYQLYQLIVNFAIPITFIVCVYVKLFLLSYKHVNRSACVANKMGIILRNLSYRRKESLIREEKKARKKTVTTSTKFLRNMKASKRIGLLVSVFLVSWLPYIVFVASNYMCQCHPRELTWIANLINYSSIAINPLIYGLMNKEIRKELLKRGTVLKSRLSSSWASSGKESREKINMLYLERSF